MIESMVVLKQMIGDLGVRLDELERPLARIPQLAKHFSGREREEEEEEKGEDLSISEEPRQSIVMKEENQPQKAERKEGSLFKGAIDRFKDKFN